MKPEGLNDCHYQTFINEGYVVVRNLLDPGEVEKLLERADGMLAGRYPSDGFICGAASNETDNDPGRLIKQIMPKEFPIKDALFASWYEHSLLKSCASFLMNASQVETFQQQVLVKEPGEANGTPWHQDNFYWKLPGSAVTAWFPLLPTSAENGTMWLLPRSHKGNILDHESAGGGSRFQSINEAIDLSGLVPLELNVGDVSFHHHQLVHGAKANSGTHRRVALATHMKAV